MENPPRPSRSHDRHEWPTGRDHSAGRDRYLTESYTDRYPDTHDDRNRPDRIQLGPWDAQTHADWRLPHSEYGDVETRPTDYPYHPYPRADATPTVLFNQHGEPRGPGGYAPAPGSKPNSPASKSHPLRQSRFRRLRSKRVVIPSILAICLILISCTFLSVQAFQRISDARAAERDVKLRITAIETLAHGGGLFQEASLRQVQSQLRGISADVGRIQASIPLASLANHNATASSLEHALLMASYLSTGGVVAIDAGVTMLQHVNGIFSGLAPSSAQQKATPPLTAADTAQMTSDLNTASQLIDQALSQRNLVRDADLQAFGLGSLVPQLHKVDALSAKLPGYITDAKTVMAALPALLGVTHPSNFLLLDLDSDELRPIGGFAGNYGILTLQGGRLSGGLHLHDIAKLDCPTSCPTNAIPAPYAWFDLAPSNFGVRDAGLDPNYPTAAKLIAQLTRQEGGPSVDGVISITPQFVEHMLDIVGPIKVAPFRQTVTGANLQEVLHYYHVAASTVVGAAELGQEYGTSQRKVFDAALGDSLVQRFGTLSASQRSAVAAAMIAAMSTKDLQIYLSNASVEGVLASHQWASALQTTGGDSFMIVDTNAGGTYANADVKEQANDSVTLDSHGMAHHHLTIQYTYPFVNHLYSAEYVAHYGRWFYRDFVRVIAPRGATFSAVHGCSPFSTTEPNHAASGCSFVLNRGNTQTVEFDWAVPGQAQPATNGALSYSLFLQRQAGSRVTVTVTVAVPAGGHIVTSQPAMRIRSAQATYSAALAKDQLLTLSWRPA